MAWGDQGGGDNKGPWGQSPWGGKPSGGGGSGGNSPPPDFDAIFKKTQEQLRQMFGSGNDGSGKPNDGKKPFFIIVASVVVLWMASGVYRVEPDEQGVVMQFGKYHRTTQPGLNYHLPYPFESVLTPRVTAVNRVEVGFRTSGSGKTASEKAMQEESLMLTGDENIVDINFEVQWKIREADKYLFNIRNPDDTVKAVSESAMREVIGQSQIATVLAAGRADVESSTKLLIQRVLDDYQSGIEIDSVNLRGVNPPDQVIAAFRDVQSARADMETARNQAETYRNDIVPRARGEGEKLVLDAEAYKQEVIARAQGEASRFSAIYNEYKLAKNVTQKRIYLETMEEVLGGMNKIVVEGGGSQGVLPYLPLSELTRKPKAEAAQ